MKNRKHYIRINVALWALLMVATAFLMSFFAPEAGKMVKNLLILGQMAGWLMADRWLKKRFELQKACCW